MNYSLSDKEVKTLAGPGTRIFTYSQVSKMSNLNQLINNQYPKAAILYQTQNEGNNVYGHWVGICKIQNSIMFFDSYGDFVDSQQKNIPDYYLLESNQTKNKIRQLLLNSGYQDMHYNEHKYQQLKKDINTCGRHVGFFLRSGLSTDQYYILMSKLKNIFKMPYDNLIVLLTDNNF
jgi:hypothetical protein